MKLFIAIAVLALLANVEAEKPSRKPKPATPDVSKLPQQATFHEGTPGFDYVKPIWEKLVNERKKSDKALFIVSVNSPSNYNRFDDKGIITFRVFAHFGSSKCSVFEILSADEEKLEQCQTNIQPEEFCTTVFDYNIAHKTWTLDQYMPCVPSTPENQEDSKSRLIK